MFFCARGLQGSVPVALYSADKILPAMLLIIILLCLHRLAVFVAQTARDSGSQYCRPLGLLQLLSPQMCLQVSKLFDTLRADISGVRSARAQAPGGLQVSGSAAASQPLRGR